MSAGKTIKRKRIKKHSLEISMNSLLDIVVILLFFLIKYYASTVFDVHTPAPNERTIIVRPAAEIPYEDVVRILDSVREVKPRTDEKLFDLVVFET